MPSFNRRGFLQLLGAAAVMPLLPALPGRALAATAGGSTSKALWAGIYAKSGSVPQFLNVARGMGLPDAAIRGVGARSVGVRVSVAAVGRALPRVEGVEEAGMSPRKIVQDIERVLMPEDEVVPEVEDLDDAPTSPEASRRHRANI